MSTSVWRTTGIATKSAQTRPALITARATVVSTWIQSMPIKMLI